MPPRWPSAPQSLNRPLLALMAIAIAGLICAGSPVSAFGYSYSSYSGHVYDAATGLPITGLGGMRNFSMSGGFFLGAEGEYSSFGLLGTTESMYVSMAGYYPGWFGGSPVQDFAKQFALGEVGPTDVDLFLDPPGTSLISGNVVDANGEPVWGARVVAYREVPGHGLWDPVEVLAITGMRGEFCLSGMPATTYKIGIVVNRAGEPEYWHGGTNLDSAADIPLGEGEHLGPVSIQLPATIGRRLPEPSDGAAFPHDRGYADIHGQVLDAGTGAPASGVPVGGSWFSGPGQSDACGRFLVTAYRSTRTTVRAQPRDDHYASYWDGQPPDYRTEFMAGTAPAWGFNLVINQVGTSTITGRLVDSAGQGVAGRRVVPYFYSPKLGIWDPVEVVAATADDGTFTIGGLPSGRYRVGVPAPDGSLYRHEFRKPGVGIAEQDTAENDGIMGDVSLDTSAPVTVAPTVAEDWAAHPVKVAFVAADEPGGSGVSEIYTQSGRDTTPTASREITISAHGATDVTYWSVDRDGNVETPRTVVVRIDAIAPVTSCDAGISRSTPATVSLVGSDGDSGVAETRWRLGASGEWSTGSTVVFSEPGLHTLEFYSVDRAGNAEGVNSSTFWAGPAGSISLAVPSISPYRDARVSGTLKDASGVPLRGRRVRIERLVGGSWSVCNTAVTDARGRYTWDARPAVKTMYRTSFLGDIGEAPSDSVTRTVLPMAKCATPAFRRHSTSATTGVLRFDRTYIVGGALKPRHAAGSASVIIRAYRREHSKWVLKRSYTATAVADGGGSRYMAKVRLPSRGSWRVRADHPADEFNAASKTDYRRVLVR